mgnify:FL=1|jgi:ubiquinone/menaquinone biosynthesis C-methylase UbiE
MKEDNSHYIIEGGEEGKARLNVLSDALFSYTKTLLEKLGLKENMYFLDNGCGGGNVALMVAKMVDKNGKVIGIDFDESIIDLCKQDAVKQQIFNVSFNTQTAYELNYVNEFDISYARFLLSHLNNPKLALEKMVEATKPNGIVVIEDLQFSGHFCYPTNEAFTTYMQLYSKAIELNGGNAEIGPSLIELFKEVGLTNIQFEIIQPVFTKGTGKWMAYLTLEKIKQKLIAASLIELEAINTLLQQLKQFTEDENTLMSLPRMFRVWGTKVNS